MDLREAERGGVGWIRVASYREKFSSIVNTVLNLQVLVAFGKFLC